MVVNYNQSIIYKICCNDTDVKDIYVGSTTNYYRRKQEHKKCCNNSNGVKYNFNIYTFIRNNGGWDNWSMVEIEKYEAKDKRELHTRERYYLELLKASLNKIVPTRTHKESSKVYRDNNKETIAIKSKEYYKNNKEHIKSKEKEYRENNKEKLTKEYICECGGRYTHGNKVRHNKTNKHTEYILINPNSFTV